MNQLLYMDIVQCLGYLFNVGDDSVKRHLCTFRLALAQRAIGRILHHQERKAILYLKIENTHNMRMHQTSHRARLAAQLLAGLTREVSMHHLDGCLCAQMQVLSQVDLGETPSPDQTEQAIVAKLLSHAVAHPRTSSRASHVTFVLERSLNVIRIVSFIRSIAAFI